MPLTEHQKRILREAGIVAGRQGVLEELAPIAEIFQKKIRTVLSFLDSFSSGHIVAVLEQHPELLDDETDEILQAISEEPGTNASGRSGIRNCRTVLWLLRFAGAPTWGEACRILEQHHSLLTRDEVDAILDALIAEQYTEDARQALVQRRNAIVLCRERGPRYAIESVSRRPPLPTPSSLRLPGMG